MDIAYIVPSAAPSQRLGDCLETISSQDVAPAEILVVADGWDHRLADLPDGARVVSLPVGMGFASACNIGIASTGSPVAALINDDVRLPKTWAKSVGQALSADQRLGAVTGITLDQRSGTRCAGSRWNKKLQAVEVSDPEEAEFLNFAAVALRRRAITTAGGLPDRYFAYYDDVDTTLRLRDSGWNTRIIPEIEVEHASSSSAPLLGYRRWFYLLRNRYWTLARHYGPYFILRHLPHTLLGDLPLIRLLAGRPDLLLLAYAQVPLYPRIRRG